LAGGIVGKVEVGVAEIGCIPDGSSQPELCCICWTDPWRINFTRLSYGVFKEFLPVDSVEIVFNQDAPKELLQSRGYFG